MNGDAQDFENPLQTLMQCSARASSMSGGRNALDVFRRRNLMADLRNQCEAASAAAVLVEEGDRERLDAVDWRRLEKLPSEYTLAFADDEGQITAVMLDPRRLLDSSAWLGTLVAALKSGRG
jgi:hypothetical protein